jgi:predicted porin
MKGKLIMAIVAGTLLVPATVFAASGMKLYGHLHVSTDFSAVHNPHSAAKGRHSVHDINVSNNHSYIGVKGFHTTFADFKAIFQVELGLPGGASSTPSPENNYKANGSVYLDDTFIGMSSPTYGTFLMLPSGESQGAELQRDFNIFRDTIGDFNNIISTFAGLTPSPELNANFDELTLAAQTNWALAYISPSYAGFSVQISDTLQGGTLGYDNDYYQGCTTKKPAAGCSQLNNSYLGWAAAIDYKHKFDALSSKVHANVNYTGVDLPGQPHIKELVAEASWTYTPTNTEVIGVYNRAFSLLYRTAYNVSVKQGLPWSTDLLLGYTHADDIHFGVAGVPHFTVNDSGADSFAIGLVHHFNKKVRLYLDYARTYNQKNANYFLGSLYHGMSIRPQQAGSHPESLSMGLVIDI